jgi:hypothetical protein
VKSGLYAPRWSDLEGDECGAALLAVVDSLVRQDENRKARAGAHLTMYEGRSVSLDSDDFFKDVGRLQPLPPLYNLIRSACDTAQADIAGRQKPKPMFMTTGADWKARRRAKKLDKFVEAQMCQSQGQYADSWQLMLDCFLDSTKIGTGVAKVFADIDQKRVRVERVLPWELHVDEREARYGAPRNIFHGYDMERDLAIETFCNVENDEEGNERRRNALLSAQPSRATGQRVVESVRIREGWKLPISDKKPGKHAIAVDGCLLHEEEWRRPRFPFLKLIWNRQSVGYWGVGIAANSEALQDCVSDTAKRLKDRMRICSTKRTYFNAATVKREDLEQGGDSELLIPCQDMSQMPQEPPVAPASQAEFEWLQMNRSAVFEIEGISMMTASAQKPSGVNAGVALQTLNDIQTVRFLPKARAYETAFETLGQLMCDAAKDIADEHGGYLVQWPGKRFLKELDWNEVSLEEDMYQIRVSPVSQFSRDPAAILEMAQELRGQGDITRETYLQMIGLPDFEEMLNRETAESEFIRDLMDRYLDSTDDDELEENGGFETPEPFMANIPGAVAICVATYWEAKRDQAPEFCLDLIRRYIVELQGVTAQGQEAQAAAAAQQQAGAFLPPGAETQVARAGSELVGGGPAAAAAA